MATRQYIGARYVPKFYDYNGSSAWRSGTEYEALTIVTVNGNSYTSKIPVPSSVGSPDQNPEYWVATGLYNEQVEAYRQLVLALADRVDDVEDDVNTMGTNLTNLTGRVTTNEGDIDDLEAEDELQNKHISDVTIQNYAQTSYGVSEIGAYDYGPGAPNGAFSVNNLLYQYFYESNDSGRLEVFDMSNGNHLRTIQNLGFCHGNDFTVVGNNVYCAPFNHDNDTGNNTLYVYNLTTGTITEDHTLESLPYKCLFGIATINESNNLIVALRPYGTNDITSTHLYEYDPVEHSIISEYTINWGGFLLRNFGFPHPMYYKNGILYLTTSYANSVLELTLNNAEHTADLYKVNQLPDYSPFGGKLTEIESICHVDYFGENFLVLGIHQSGGYGFKFVGYPISGNAPVSLVEYIEPLYERTSINYNPSSQSIFETGSSLHPFKLLNRALMAYSYYSVGGTREVELVLPSVVNENLHIYREAFIIQNEHTFNGKVQVIQGNLTITGACTFNNEVVATRNSMLSIQSGTYKHDFGIYNNSQATVWGCTFDNSGHRIDISNAFVQIGLADVTQANLYGAASGKSIVALNTPDSHGLSILGGSTCLTPGTK